ncbi:MAG: hypothetical protein ABF689_14935 [Gluconobacter cerinus]|uniref:hypothetical protein n=1 Tax=Gluconobacter cerinus TaxID=38307 RepID=UPI0039ED7F6D
MLEPLHVEVRSEFPKGLLEELTKLVTRRADDLVSIVLSKVIEDLTACTRLEVTGSTKDAVVIRWLWPENLDGKVLSAFRALGLDLHEGRFFGHDSSSVLADGESGDSVAADPRDDATPDTSAKGVRDDG